MRLINQKSEVQKTAFNNESKTLVCIYCDSLQNSCEILLRNQSETFELYVMMQNSMHSINIQNVNAVLMSCCTSMSFIKMPQQRSCIRMT